jgi:glycogen(starch) synthase
MADLGYEVKLYTATLGSESTVEEGSLTTHFVSWPQIYPHKRSLTFALEYRVWLRKTMDKLRLEIVSGDVLYLHGAAMWGLCRISKAMSTMGVAVIGNPHGMEEFGPLTVWTAANRMLLRRMVRSGGRLCDAVIATDSSLVSGVVTNLQIVREKVKLIPNGVKIESLQYEQPSILKGSNLRVVSVGRLSRNKGYDLLAEALVKFSQRGIFSIDWTHYGEGEERLNVERVCGREKSGKLNFNVVSGAENSVVHRAIQLANVFVQPSRYEGSSLTTLEAMALGTVVVATPVGGIPDKIVDGFSGILATEADAHSIEHALGRYVVHDDIVTLSRSARAKVDESFSVSRLALRHQELFLNILVEVEKND